jgi:prepilin-type N-terminal cleavage/methylation domain-containing protein
MNHRPGVTLLEVLIAIFVMAIGLLALLTLFPLAALNMGQALQHDRAASAASLAAEYALALDLRQDPNVTGAFTTPPRGYTGPPGDPSGPSWPVYADGFGFAVNPNGALGAAPGTPGITRVLPSYAPSLQLIARWFSLPDDLAFGPDATPARGLVQRGGRYTWAYLLRRPRASSPAVVDLNVVVYSGRDTQLGGGEVAYAATGARGESSLTLTYSAAQGKPALRRNAWVLDVTLDDATKVTRGAFYRVVNVAEVDPRTLSLEVEGPLEANLPDDQSSLPRGTVVVLDNVIEVLRMGTGWAP